MKKSKKARVIFILLFIVAVASSVYLFFIKKDSPKDVLNYVLTSKPQDANCIDDPSFERLSSNSIKIFWNDSLDEEVTEYSVMRANMDKKSEWKKLTSIKSDGKIDKNNIEYEDKFDANGPTQFRYRIDVTKKEDEHVIRGKEVIASNILVCLDPGHFNGKTPVTGDKTYDYCEGSYTIKIGLELRDVLKKKYGISSLMTRDSEHITIDNLTDQELDGKKIFLRGEKSKGCDLFISLHTNANGENANDTKTNEQPTNINKTLVLMNKVGMSNDTAIKVANNIGIQVSKINYNLKLSTSPNFETASVNKLKEWTGPYNDGLDQIGSVCYRHNPVGKDYYDVLKGSTNVNVAGMIVEHGFHTIVDVRRCAKENDLYKHWALADAKGIAIGYGFAIDNENKNK